MLPTPETLVVRTIVSDIPATITIIHEYSGSASYSRKRPDPPVFTDSVDPTFESWKIQI